MLFWKKLEALIPLALHRAVLTSELEQVTAGVTEVGQGHQVRSVSDCFLFYYQVLLIFLILEKIINLL